MLVRPPLRSESEQISDMKHLRTTKTGLWSRVWLQTSVLRGEALVKHSLQISPQMNTLLARNLATHDMNLLGLAAGISNAAPQLDLSNEFNALPRIYSALERQHRARKASCS